LEWVQIPNSVLTSHLGDAYFAAMGLPRPSQRPAPNANQVTWGANKYGITYGTWENLSWWTAAGHYSYSGMAVDPLGAILVGGGDSYWAENGYHRFNFAQDVPAWQQAVITPCHKDFIKKPVFPRTSPDTYPTVVAGDDARDDRMYDGSHRGGHSYHFQAFIPQRNWIVHFGQQQYWPLDLGFSSAVHVADVATGRWETDNPIGARPNLNNDELPWGQVDPTTGDFYCFGLSWGDLTLHVWRQVTNVWQTLLTIPGTNGFRCSGSIDWQHRELLIAGNYQATQGRWLVNFQNNSVVPVTIAGAYAFGPYRNGGVWWCPDLQKHLHFRDDGFIYTLTKTGAAQFTIERVTATGAAPAAGSLNAKGGGVLNNFQYIATLKGMILRCGDNLPMYFMRTGA